MYAPNKKTKNILKLSSEQGFSLLEVLIVISIFAIIVSLAAPSMTRSIADQNIKNTTSILRAALEEARVESVIRRQNVTVTYNAAATPNTLTVTDADDDEISSYNIKENIQINVAPDASTFIFEPTKRLQSGIDTTFTVCANNIENETPMQVVASAITNITTSRSGVCP